VDGTSGVGPESRLQWYNDFLSEQTEKQKRPVVLALSSYVLKQKQGEELHLIKDLSTEVPQLYTLVNLRSLRLKDSGNAELDIIIVSGTINF